MEEIKVWLQMFFEDGSVSQGVRIPAEFLREDHKEMLEKEVEKILNSLNRQEGYYLVWGAGNLRFGRFSTSFLSQESDSSASSQQKASRRSRKKLKSPPS